MNSSLEDGHRGLKNSKVIFLTLGTSWIYRHKTTKEVVANCHKVPSSHFERELISHKASFERLFNILSKDFYKDKQIVLTVSPIRHAKDGFVQNSVSKANLMLLCYELCHTLDNVEYFPSYEIFMDELRDYRFYQKDMLHPTQLGVDVVWERIKSATTGAETQKMMEEIKQIKRDLNHRPKQPQSQTYQLFKEKVAQKIAKIESQLGRKIESKETI